MFHCDAFAGTFHELTADTLGPFYLRPPQAANGSPSCRRFIMAVHMAFSFYRKTMELFVQFRFMAGLDKYTPEFVCVSLRLFSYKEYHKKRE
jgi:hypothetical protein